MEEFQLPEKEISLSLNDLEQLYSDDKLQTNFIQIFAASLFYEKSIKINGYKPASKIGKYINLTEKGLEWANLIRNRFESHSIDEIKYVLFILLFHDRLFIDLENTNIEELLKTLNLDILEGRLKHPFFYDRVLYNSYYERFNANLEDFSYEATITLIDGTPEGVFQLGKLLIGSFGIIQSMDSRLYSPEVEDISLYHCVDPSCGQIHECSLNTGDGSIMEIIEVFQSKMTGTGDSSEFQKYFKKLVGETDNFYNELQIADLPVLLCSAFNEEELRIVTERFLRKRYEEIENRIPPSRKFIEVFSLKKPNKIVKQLNKPECIQIILIFPDNEIISTIENLLDMNSLTIPKFEIRTPWIEIKEKYIDDYSCEISQYGIRTINESYNPIYARLKWLILYIYQDNLKDLKWKLKIDFNANLHKGIDTYLAEVSPVQVLDNLIFQNIVYLEKTLQFLNYDNSILKIFQDRLELLKEKILWKLGYNMYTLPRDTKFRLKKLLKNMELIVKNNLQNWDESKEEVVKAGTLLGRSLEKFLELSLSFCTWVLLKDHFRLTKFTYNPNAAREFMIKKLNNRDDSKKKKSTFEEKKLIFEEKKLTLFPLIHGFASLGSLCEEILSNEMKYIRPENELPAYYGKAKVLKFPFLHKILFLDIGEGEPVEIIERLKSITQRIVDSKIRPVRNKLVHYKEAGDFPKPEDILTACEELKSIIDQLDDYGFYPSIYLRFETKIDQFGRTLVSMKNYEGNQEIIFAPSEFDGVPSYEDPQIIVPSVHIRNSAECIRFSYKEKSDYSQFWSNYPLKREGIS